MNSDPLRHYAVMLKPVGSSCNLRCEYCYYLGKGKPSDARLPRMSDAVLESSVRQILEIHGRDAIVEFAWHGGEPALAGIDFFTRALELQNKYGAGRKIINAIQTNGTTMNADWARFFAKNRFLVGVSLDGPKYLHDRFRHNAGGAGSFDGVMNAISLFREYGADYNILCTVNSENQMRGREVYRFLRGLSRFIQFLPVVECLPAEYESERGQRFAMPPGRYSPRVRHPITPFSATGEGCGKFLADILDEWYSLGDPGKIQVQQINAALANRDGVPCGLCAHEAVCGHAAVIELNGEVFRCDRYVFAEYSLGNLLETPLETLMQKNRDFGMHKTCSLPESCLQCPYIRLCFGGCPKDRFLADSAGAMGKNYLCEGYKMFYRKLLDLNLPG